MKKRRKSFLKRTGALAIAASMLMGLTPMPAQVQAQYVSGNAPFINSWLVSGPFDTSVADEIYGTVAPENPNLAKTAKTSASSATLASNPTDFLVDGSTRNQWVTEGSENPCWARLSWDTPINLGYMTIAQWGDGRHVNQWYDLIFTFEDGSSSESVRVNSTSSSPDSPTAYVPTETLKGVTSVTIEVDKGRDPYPSITGISEVEVYEYGLEENIATYRIAEVSDGEEENVALYATAEASSTWQNNAYDYPDVTDKPSSKALPQLAIDGNLATEWIAQMHDTLDAPDTWPNWDPKPTLALTWDTAVTVKRLVLYERHNDAWGADTSNVERVDYTLKGRNGQAIETGTIDSFVADSPDGVELVLPEAVKGVVSAEFAIIYHGQKNYHNVGLGFREVEVYGTVEEEALPELDVKITPELGESMIEGGLKWEYFDDRIWNRSYDDYQDLYGYYSVKKGVNTQNKYVYAHTYVYSPKQQKVQFRFGSSGEHRLYVNDIAVTSPSKPAEVQKDMVKKDITLKEGWNKILLQIKHTYTDDKNANGVPIAKDNDVYYLGFYGRITDASGNEVEGLEYSVTGTDTDLTITTGGLYAEDAVDDGKIGRGLPENEMPTGYTEWPYVWNTPKTSSNHDVSATAFRFMADGGQPGYTWSLVEGSALPKGLSLNEDGTIGGYVDCEPGEYPFAIQVTDAKGNTAVKDFSITIKERPNKWLEEGRVSALSHTGPIYQYFVDPNFSVDLWAERASRQGHSLVSVEALQQNYYWPSRFADPEHDRNKYLPKDENGQVVDGLKQFEKAVKRYGMKFGLYYATEGGGLQHYSTDVFVQNVEDLILRYDPDYLYFDGPQTMPNANYDVMYSNVRNYSDEIIINSNTNAGWSGAFGDADLRTVEASGIYSGAYDNAYTKRTVMEPWKSIHTKNNYTPYYARRDDYRLVAQEMIMNAGRGMVDNNDQMPIMSRGTNWDSPEDVATRYPKSLQEFIDVREGLAAWFAPEGKTERHESTTGTMPYFLNGSTCGCTDDGDGNIDHFEQGHGPKWGYSTYRDNNIYLHIMKGPDGRTGFEAIANRMLTVDPIQDTVEKVIWLNEDQEIPFTQDGGNLTIDLSSVEEDQVDTIIKIVTDNPQREYQLTNVVAEGEQVAPGQLQIHVEGYMTYQALKAKLESVTYTSEDSSIAAVDADGMVTPVSDGTTTIHITGTYEGVAKEDTLKVVSRDGIVYVGEEMIGASLWVEDRESYGEITHLTEIPYHLEGRSEKGGAIGLDGAEITMKSAMVDLDGGDKYTPVKLVDSDLITFADGKLISKQVSETTRMAVWAEVELDGNTFTTNRVYLDVHPYNNLSSDASITSDNSLPGYDAQKVADDMLIEGAAFDASKWSADGTQASALAFDLKSLCTVNNIEINFNSKSQNYYNTPKTMEIQVSENGFDWNTVKTVTPPTSGQGAYFGYADIYEIEPVNTRYVRLYFPDGSNGSTLDILEVAVNGTDLANRLAAIDVEGETISDTAARLNITGYNGMGNELSLDGADIQISSLNPEIICIDENNQLQAVAEGRAQIQVQVSLNGSIAEAVLYADVDSEGKLFFGDYLKSIQVTPDSKTVSVNDPVSVQVRGILNTGEQADLSSAEIEYLIAENAPVSQLEGNNVLYMPEAISQSQQVPVQVQVTLGGVTVISEEILFTAQGSNIAADAKVTVSSVRSRSGSYDGDDVDDRYVGEKAIDGDAATTWAAKQSDHSPWIQLDFGEEKLVQQIVLVDRGHAVNEIGEGLLQFFDADGNEVKSMTVTDIQWEGQPENIVELEEPVVAASIKFTIDPEGKFYHGSTSDKPERGLGEFRVVCAESTENKIESFQPVYAETMVGVVPVLPETVTAVYSDLTSSEVSVQWEPVSSEVISQPGTIEVEGIVEGTTLKAIAVVQVKEREEEPGDKTLLQKTYEYALTLNTDGVTDSAKDFFEKAMVQAKAVLDDENAVQAEIDEAWDTLLEGIWGLGLVQGDKTMLEQLILKGNAMMDEADKYVQDNWQQLIDTLEQAKQIMDDGNAMESDVQTAADALLQAILAQRYKADKSILEELLKQANRVDTSRYTEESVNFLMAAMRTANLTLADESLSQDDQEQVDQVAKELENALRSLQLKEQEEGQPSDTSKNDNVSQNENVDSPATGDVGLVFCLMALALISMASVWFITMLRKKIYPHQ